METERDITQHSRRNLKSHQLKRLCEKFVVRPLGGSLYLIICPNTNFRLKAELRTVSFHTVSEVGGVMTLHIVSQLSKHITEVKCSRI